MQEIISKNNRGFVRDKVLETKHKEHDGKIFCKS